MELLFLLLVIFCFYLSISGKIKTFRRKINYYIIMLMDFMVKRFVNLSYDQIILVKIPHIIPMAWFFEFIFGIVCR